MNDRKPLTTKVCDAAFKGDAKGRPEMRPDGLIPGLYLLVTRHKKSWGFQFTPPGGGKARTKMVLGHGTGVNMLYPTTGIHEARLRAEEIKAILRAGKDPRQVAKIKAATKMTISELCDLRFREELAHSAKKFKWTCLEIERCYDRDIIPAVGDVYVEDFRIKHLRLVIQPIIDRGSHTQANRVYQHVQALLDFAVRATDEIELNPLAACKPPNKEKAKTRALSLAEIRQVWHGAPGAMSRSESVPDILRLMLATGQRPGEECGAIERHEVDLAKRLWTIPAYKTKNKAGDHVVPLNDLACEILAERMRATNSKFLFPNNEGDGPIPNHTIATCLARALVPALGFPLGRLGVAKFTPHDLRRTMGSQMAENLKTDHGDTLPEIYISHVMNHRSATKKTVTSMVYNQYQYLAEKQEALEKWGAFLTQVLAGVDSPVALAA
jgi:integrase